MITRVKICGITNKEDARMCALAGADALGFIFVDSPRSIEPEQAAAIISSLPPFVNTVGVFVNETAEQIMDVVQISGVDVIQLHGEETPEFCKSIAEFGCKVVKVMRVRDNSAGTEAAFYRVDAIMLDTYSPEKQGGTGQRIDTRFFEQFQACSRPLIVSGGLRPENVREIIDVLHPWAVDVASGVEFEPGKKDAQKVARFIQAVKGE